MKWQIAFIIFGLGVIPLVNLAQSVPNTTISDNSPLPAAPKTDLGFKNLFDYKNTSSAFYQELNPLAISFVSDYMHRHGKQLSQMRTTARPYFDVIDAIFVQYNLPKELKYLAVIESNLNPYVVSWAGAVGPWQFMAETGRRMGLRITPYVDERTDYFKSTHAAAKYLKELYGDLGDWLLVIAAYNGGPGRVYSAMRKSGSRDFWQLQYHLPEESRNHVKKFIATHYIMEGRGSITTGQPENETNATEEAGFAKKAISGRYASVVIAKTLAMDIQQFNQYNPQFDKVVGNGGTYQLKLPIDKMQQFENSRYQILQESLRLLLGQDLTPPHKQ